MTANFGKKYQVAITFTLLALISSLQLLFGNPGKRGLGLFFITLMAVTAFSNDYLIQNADWQIADNVKRGVAALIDLAIGSIVLFIILFIL